MLTFLLFLALTPEVDKLAAPAGGTVGVAAVRLETGHHFAVRERERFPMYSVFKLPVAIELAAQLDAGLLVIDDEVQLTAADRRAGPEPGLAAKIPTRVSIRRLLEAMLVEGDNTACDKILSLIGGPRAVNERMAKLGLHQIVVDRTEAELAAGKAGNTATPEAMAILLAKLSGFDLGLSEELNGMILDHMAHAVPGARRIAAGVPAGTPLQHRTGSSRAVKGVTEATNDVGIIRLPDGGRVALVVFLRNARGSEPAREAAIAAIAKAAYEWALADKP
jgi:beta-lactamase class A